MITIVHVDIDIIIDHVVNDNLFALINMCRTHESFKDVDLTKLRDIVDKYDNTTSDYVRDLIEVRDFIEDRNYAQGNYNKLLVKYTELYFTNNYNKLLVKYKELQDKYKELEKYNTHLLTRPPTQGGIEYSEAKYRFENDFYERITKKLIV